jgi:hypothetical protein
MKKLILASLAVLILALASYPLWRASAKRNKWFLISTNIYQDLLRRTSLRSDQIGGPPAERAVSEVPAYLSRVDDTFDMYLRHLELSQAAIDGKRVLEIGPGDNLGVALRFIAAGASQVVALDKFAPLQTTAFHRALYRTIRDRATEEERRRIDEAIDLSKGVVVKPQRLEYVYGRGIEEAGDVFGDRKFDFIVSSAVLEEVYQIDEAFAGLDKVFVPGGYQVHIIDLRDYGVFTKHGFHPLEFLTVPDFFYRFMVESSGQPNRRLVDYYRNKMSALGYRSKIYTTWVLGNPAVLSPPRSSLTPGTDYGQDAVAQVQAIRPRLLERYRNLPDEDLIVQAILLVAHRPAAAAPAETR